MILKTTILSDDEQVPLFPETGYLAIRESMDFLFTTATFKMEDMLSVFVSQYPFMQNSKIGLVIESENESRGINLIPYDIAMDHVDSANEAYTLHFDLISKFANPFLLHSEYFSKRCTASDYVKYMADSFGFSYEIEATKGIESWVNPNWKAGQMLRYLASRSISARGSAGYMYYISAEGVLVFKTIDKFFEDAGEIEDITVNYSNEDVHGLSISNSLFKLTVGGGNYLKAKFFDLNTSKFIEKEVLYNQYIQKRAKYSGVSNELMHKGPSKYFGEMYYTSEFPKDVVYEMFKKSLLFAENNEIFVTLRDFSFSRRIGNIINLVVHGPVAEGIDLNYSGHYLVKGITSKVQKEGFQTLQLIRPGYNIRQREGII